MQAGLWVEGLGHSTAGGCGEAEVGISRQLLAPATPEWGCSMSHQLCALTDEHCRIWVAGKCSAFCAWL